MTVLTSLIICIAMVSIAVIVIYKGWAAIQQRAWKQVEVHRLLIEPSLTFYVKELNPSTASEKRVYIKNIGKGKAIDIMINDFYHPKEKDWHFIFQKLALIDPGEEIKIDYNFFVGEQKAFNKYDLLWMFDLEHDHDFVAKVVICFSDIEGNRYSQTNIIGKGEHRHGKPILIKEED